MTKKILLVVLCWVQIFYADAQCSINTFIQDNYDLDAKILALRQIVSDPTDPDYDNPFISDVRANFHKERLSALQANPDNIPEIDSIFNYLRYHTNSVYNIPVAYKEILFSVNTSTPWVDTLKDTGMSGVPELDNFITNYQFFNVTFSDSSTTGNTLFFLRTDFDLLNIRALVDDLEALPDIIVAEALYDDTLGLNYSGDSYLLKINTLFGVESEYAAVTDIIYNEDTGKYEFFIAAGDCFSGCTLSRKWYAEISDDCSVVNFFRTLSTTENELTDILIYPNPVSEVIYFKGITSIQSVALYSMLGKQIEVSINNSNEIDVSFLKDGIYFLKITDEQNRSTLRKFIKK